MKNQHTPEPWKFVDREQTGHSVILTEDGKSGIAVPIGKIRGCEVHVTEMRANARRIVACVNACAKLSTEAIESGVIGDLRDGAASEQMRTRREWARIDTWGLAEQIAARLTEHGAGLPTHATSLIARMLEVAFDKARGNP